MRVYESYSVFPCPDPLSYGKGPGFEATVNTQLRIPGPPNVNVDPSDFFSSEGLTRETRHLSLSTSEGTVADVATPLTKFSLGVTSRGV